MAPSTASISAVSGGPALGPMLPVAGNAAFRYIERAVALASAGEADAIAPAPQQGCFTPADTSILATQKILAALTETRRSSR